MDDFFYKEPTNVTELANYIQRALDHMQQSVQGTFEKAMTRINDLGGRLDELEREVADIMTEGGVRIPAGER